MTDFSRLDVAGRIATPDDSDWDQARMAWNLAADQRPSAVAFVESGDDIAAVVRLAAENDLRVSGQSTGHGGSKPTTTACTRRWSPGRRTGATSTSPSAPATPTRSSRPRPAPASPR
ncbi:MAG TPA: hypothetical protein VKB23_01010 [Solirubrobacterales bacterium]|nr:hypothetical protein [Solirubrobacterales bacterium]